MTFGTLKPRTTTTSFEVIGFTGANNTIGIAGTKNVDKWIHGEGGDELPEEWFRRAGMPSRKWTSGRPRTPARLVTELGHQGAVWSQANGSATSTAFRLPQS